MIAEPPRLAQQMNNCWLTSLVQLFYNMESFTDYLCGPAGDVYANFDVAKAMNNEEYNELFAETEKFMKKNNYAVDDKAGKYVLTGMDEKRIERFYELYSIRSAVPQNEVAKSYVGLVRHIRKGVGANDGYVERLLDLQKKISDMPYKKGGMGEICSIEDHIGPLQGAFLKIPYFWGITFSGGRSEKYCELWNLARGTNVFELWLNDNEVAKLGPITAAGEYLLFVTHITDELSSYNLQDRFDLVVSGKTLEYQLIGIAMYEGWAHYTAYVKDQRDLQRRWYACDGMGMRVELVANQQAVLGPWDMRSGNRQPRILVYRQVTQKHAQEQQPQEEDPSLTNLVKVLQMLV